MLSVAWTLTIASIIVTVANASLTVATDYKNESWMFVEAVKQKIRCRQKKGQN